MPLWAAIIINLIHFANFLFAWSSVFDSAVIFKNYMHQSGFSSCALGDVIGRFKKNKTATLVARIKWLSKSLDDRQLNVLSRIFILYLHDAPCYIVNISARLAKITFIKIDRSWSQD